MPRRTTQHRKSTRTNPLAQFLRRPVVQIGLVLAAVIVIVMIALSGSGSKLDSARLPDVINTAQAYQLYQQKGAFFVDVREKSEWDSVHIPDVTLIPLGDLPDRINEVPRDRPIVVVCHSGNRSRSGRDILKQAGYSNVTSMTGGITDWQAQGFPTQP